MVKKIPFLLLVAFLLVGGSAITNGGTGTGESIGENIGNVSGSGGSSVPVGGDPGKTVYYPALKTLTVEYPNRIDAFVADGGNISTDDFMSALAIYYKSPESQQYESLKTRVRTTGSPPELYVKDSEGVFLPLYIRVQNPKDKLYYSSHAIYNDISFNDMLSSHLPSFDTDLTTTNPAGLSWKETINGNWIGISCDGGGTPAKELPLDLVWRKSNRHLSISEQYTTYDPDRGNTLGDQYKEDNLVGHDSCLKEVAERDAQKNTKIIEGVVVTSLIRPGLLTSPEVSKKAIAPKILTTLIPKLPEVLKAVLYKSASKQVRRFGPTFSSIGGGKESGTNKLINGVVHTKIISPDFGGMRDVVFATPDGKNILVFMTTPRGRVAVGLTADQAKKFKDWPSVKKNPIASVAVGVMDKADGLLPLSTLDLLKRKAVALGLKIEEANLNLVAKKQRLGLGYPAVGDIDLAFVFDQNGNLVRLKGCVSAKFDLKNGRLVC